MIIFLDGLQFTIDQLVLIDLRFKYFSMVRARRREKSSEIEVSLLRALSADVAVSESSVARESEHNQTKAFCPVFFLV